MNNVDLLPENSLEKPNFNLFEAFFNKENEEVQRFVEQMFDSFLEKVQIDVENILEEKDITDLAEKQWEFLQKLVVLPKGYKFVPNMVFKPWIQKDGIAFVGKNDSNKYMREKLTKNLNKAFKAGRIYRVMPYKPEILPFLRSFFGNQNKTVAENSKRYVRRFENQKVTKIEGGELWKRGLKERLVDSFNSTVLSYLLSLRSAFGSYFDVLNKELEPEQREAEIQWIYGLTKDFAFNRNNIRRSVKEGLYATMHTFYAKNKDIVLGLPQKHVLFDYIKTVIDFEKELQLKDYKLHAVPYKTAQKLFELINDFPFPDIYNQEMAKKDFKNRVFVRMHQHFIDLVPSQDQTENLHQFLSAEDIGLLLFNGKDIEDEFDDGELEEHALFEAYSGKQLLSGFYANNLLPAFVKGFSKKENVDVSQVFFSDYGVYVREGDEVKKYEHSDVAENFFYIRNAETVQERIKISAEKNAEIEERLLEKLALFGFSFEETVFKRLQGVCRAFGFELGSETWTRKVGEAGKEQNLDYFLNSSLLSVESIRKLEQFFTTHKYLFGNKIKKLEITPFAEFDKQPRPKTQKFAKMYAGKEIQEITKFGGGKFRSLSFRNVGLLPEFPLEISFIILKGAYTYLFDHVLEDRKVDTPIKFIKSTNSVPDHWGGGHKYELHSVKKQFFSLFKPEALEKQFREFSQKYERSISDGNVRSRFYADLFSNYGMAYSLMIQMKKDNPNIPPNIKQFFYDFFDMDKFVNQKQIS